MPAIISDLPVRRSVALPEEVDVTLRSHLLATEGEEDLAFALYTPSYGAKRTSALIHRVILPEDGDRQQHGNVSFNLQYFERVLDFAVQSRSGVAFLHSHIGPGWQGMSPDDVVAERRLAGPAYAVTDLPLVGLTLGTDGAWSARHWEPGNGREFDRQWCETVRVAGIGLAVTYDERQIARPEFREMFKRTRTVWGDERHAHLARLRVGVVGLGSVGMAVTEQLARGGVQQVTLIEFDEVQLHNLDRLQGASRADVGRLKAHVAGDLFLRSATAAQPGVAAAPFSVVEAAGFAAALDCDVLFSCVDRPRARQMLNHIAFAHLIPVIDGGIAVRFRSGEFAGAEWQTQTVAPSRPCLECLGAFDTGDADTERAGMLEDPSYLKGLPIDHRLRHNENVFAFTANLAAMEMFQFVGLASGIPALRGARVQRFHLIAGSLETDESAICKSGCDISQFVGTADRCLTYVGRDLAAENARARQRHGGE